MRYGRSGETECGTLSRTRPVALVRQRRYRVENVTQPPSPDEAMLVDMSYLDDYARGETLSVLWEHELDPRIIEDDDWSAVADKGFDDPTRFDTYLHALSWSCVTATDPNLLRVPFRAGIRTDAYQVDLLCKALRLPGVNLFIAGAYRVRAVRVDPLGLVYLWPRTG